ncbi:MAG: iron ABC transporter permease [Gluconacetobacter liquefaciens]
MAYSLARAARRETPVLVTVIVLFGLIIVPVLSMAYNSVETPLGMLSWRYWAEVLGTARYQRAIGHTLLLAIPATVLAGAIGLGQAWLIVRSDLPGKRFLHMASIVPFFLSPFLGAVAWGMLLSPHVGLFNRLFMLLGIGPFDIYSSFGIVWVTGLYYAPYVYLFVQSALHNLDPSVEEAAAICGLRPLGTFLRITLPLISPALISALLLTLVAATGQFAVPALLGAPVRIRTMTTYIYDLSNMFPPRFGLAAVLSLLLVGIAAAGLVVQKVLLGGRSFVTVSARASKQTVVPLGRMRRPLFGVLLAFVLATTVLPIVMLFYASLVPHYDGSLTLGLLTFAHYREIFLSNHLVESAVWNSLWFAGISATASLLLAVWISVIMNRTHSPLRAIIDFMVTIPAAIPGVTLGVALLWTWIDVPLPVYGTGWLLFIGYIVGFMPFAVRAVSSVHRQIDVVLEDALRMAGGNALQRLRHVTLPLLKPGIASGWVLVFVICVRELDVPVLLYSPGNEVLSVLIFSRWEDGDYGMLAAMAAIQIMLITVVLIAASWLFRVEVAPPAS